MADSRLTHAVATGRLTLPDGVVEVLRPPAGWDLSALPRGAVRISHGFRPDADWWQAAGYPVAREPGVAAAALIIMPRSRALARDMLARAARIAPLVIVDGQRSEGVDGLWREVRARIGEVPTVTRGHGRLFWFAPPAGAFDDWAAPPPRPARHGFVTAPGVFSADEPDRGSVLLAAALPSRLPSRMADLGAGWGFLSVAVLARAGVDRLDLIEAEAAALDCARRNITDPRAVFHWADAARFAPAEPYGGIVTNPPFHLGRRADPALGRSFIEAAARMLGRDGTLWLVANRHLPYEAQLSERFRELREIGDDSAYKILEARRPRAS